MKRESNQEMELNLPQLWVHLERATQMLSVLLSLLSSRFKCVGVRNPSSCGIDGTHLWFTKSIACVAVSRNMATPNWRGAHVFWPTGLWKLPSTISFVFDREGAEGRLNMHWEIWRMAAATHWRTSCNPVMGHDRDFEVTGTQVASVV
jgi:hypothetical protein